MKNRYSKAAPKSQSIKKPQGTGPKPLKKQKRIKKIKEKRKQRDIQNYIDLCSRVDDFVGSNNVFFSQAKSEITKRWRHFPCNIDMREVFSIQNKKMFKEVNNQMAEKEVYKFLETVKQYYTHCFQKIALINKSNQSIFIPFIFNKNSNGKKKSFGKNIEIISNNEEYLFQNREPLIKEITQFVNQSSTDLQCSHQEIPQDYLQLIYLCKILKKIQRQIMKEIEKLEEYQDPLFQIRPIENSQQRYAQKSKSSHKKGKNTLSKKNIKPEIPLLQDEYIKWLVFKNFQKTINDEIDIDFYNYHKSIQAQQDNRYYDKNFLFITKFQDFKLYIKNRIPKKLKAPIYNLRTPCSACFSSFSQLENPIIKCKECSIRIHKYCQKQTTRCQRCKYCRTSNQQKSKTGYCYICKRDIQKGLLVNVVSNTAPHYYAHTFCLYINKKWSVQDGEVKGHYTKLSEKKEHECNICKKNEGLFFNCKTCNKEFHGMCAYLQGYQFILERKNQATIEKSYIIDINCCKIQQFIERRSIQRKFKLNFQKIVFKRSRQLMNYIQKLHEPQKVSKKRVLRAQNINENQQQSKDFSNNNNDDEMLQQNNEMDEQLMRFQRKQMIQYEQDDDEYNSSQEESQQNRSQYQSQQDEREG